MYMYVPGLAQAGGARKSRTLAVTRAPKWDCFFSGVDLNSGQVGDSRVCAAWHRPGELCPWRDRECEHSTPSLENQGQSPQQKTSPCPFPKSSTQAVLGVLCTSRSPDRPRTTLGLPAAETVLLSLHLGVCEKEESKHERFLATPRGTGSPAGTCGVQSGRGAQARGQWKSRGTLLRALLNACTKASCSYSPVVPSREVEKLAGDVFLQGWLCLAMIHSQTPRSHSSNAQR